jgi:hypothetical protein
MNNREQLAFAEVALRLRPMASTNVVRYELDGGLPFCEYFGDFVDSRSSRASKY